MIIPSVYNRLTTSGVDTAGSTARRHGGRRRRIGRDPETERVMQDVERDLRRLLNTRCVIDVNLDEAQNSIAAYGLRDFDQKGRALKQIVDGLKRMIEKAVERFEPRILNLEVICAAEVSPGGDISFEITGNLKMGDREEPVRYDTKLDVAEGIYQVRVGEN